MADNTKNYTLMRTGDVAVTFEGELIAEKSSYRREGPGEGRWHELRLYRTAAATYVVQIIFKSCYRGEDIQYLVEYAKDIAEVRRPVVGHDPVPAGLTERLAERPGTGTYNDYVHKLRGQARDLRARYRVAVSELFAAAGVEFVETIT